MPYIPSRAAPRIHLHLIAYDDASKAACTGGWRVLDNAGNERPDWREYWPMRRFLLTALQDGSLDEAAWYGFFSPKFTAKTGLSYEQAHEFVAQHAGEADVVSFSPQFDMGAFFLNVFEQAEMFDAGFIDATAAWLAEHGWHPDLRQRVMDSRQAIFSNFFVAKPAFWREWLLWNERLFAVCESPTHPLSAALTQATLYDGVMHPDAVQRKVFLMERIVALLLAEQPQWRCVPHNAVRFVWSDTRLRDFPAEALMSDALKRAYRDTGFSEYLSAFAKVRKAVQSH